MAEKASRKKVAGRKRAEKTSQKLKKRARKRAEKMTEKKVSGRRLTLALGIACIALLVGLVAAIVVYTPMINNSESQIAEKDNTISSMNKTISSMNKTISSMNRQILVLQNTLSQITLNQSDISALESQISALNSILYLNESGFLVSNLPVNQAAGANTTVFNNILDFAGYVTVAVQSNSTKTYVEVIYSSYGVNYDNNVTVGTGGTAAFPVLPGSVEIRVGNTDSVDSVAATVTATYYY